jgi:predicted ATPase/DNA-binding CsgD family transcriptional regulator
MIRNYSFEYPLPFVGRTQEVADITTRLLNPECRLLTLTGLGGSGKTRLALEAANTVAAQFAQGAVFVGLQPLARSDLLLPAIAQAVGTTFYGDGDPQQQLLDFLHGKALLLILDNFEHVLDGAALVTSLLTSAPGLTILATSREALALREEWLYPLKGMATPPSVYATSLEDYEAIHLFLSHARRAQPHFDLANEHQAVIRICQMTAGLPLAIELAASWLKGLSAAQIAHAMQRNLDFLATTTRNLEQRHRSMRVVFDQSWALLSENERMVFARLSVFPGGFDGDAAEQVAEASLPSLAALVEKSLLQLDPAGRFGMHELLRQYGIEQLEAYGENEAIYARHSQYFAQLMLQHETALKQPQQLATMQAIERDFDNIRLAWEWSAKHQQATQLHTMLNGLFLFGFLGRRYHEIITMFQQSLEQSAADAPLHGRLLARRWGFLHWWHQEDYQEALAGTEQALTIALAKNNQFETAFCHLMAAYALNNMQRYGEALTHLETSQALFEALNEPYYVCWALHRLGFVYLSLNNIARANEYAERSLAIARVTHNRVALVICLYNLGLGYMLNRDYVMGRRHYEEALQITSGSGHQGQIAHALSLLALCAFCQGDYITCREYAERSRAITEDIDLRIFQAYSLALLIILACIREDYAEATLLNDIVKGHSTNTMGFQLLYWAQATLACGLGRPAEARVYIQKALRLSASNANPITTIWVIPSVAYTLVDIEPEKAIELLSWASAQSDTTLNWVRQWPLIGRVQAQLQEAIGGDAYRMHREKGASLSFASINSYLQQEFRASSDAGAEESHYLLTAREREILGLMAAGMTNPQIAGQLVIGAGTVKTHTLNIYRKLEVANRTQAIVRAQEAGLLPA